MGFADDMKELEGAFKEAMEEPRQTGDFGPELKDGQHQAMVVEAKVTQRSSDDHWQFYLKFQNQEGSIRKWSDLDHEIGLKIAAQDVALLGYDGELAGLEKACERGKFLNLVCGIGVKTTPGQDRDFRNVYVNRCMGLAEDPSMFELSAEAAAAAPVSGAPVASAPPADDDIPF